MISKSNKKILVVGATGHQGGAVVESLLRNGWSVDALTRGRDRDAVRNLERRGARVVKGDLEDRFSLDKALKGVYGVFGVTTFMEGGPEGEIRRGKLLADAVKDAGVKHYIFSSVAAADRNTEIPHFDSKRDIEIYIRQLGIDATIFRPVSFMSNYDRPETHNEILNGKFRSGILPDKKTQLIALEDLGDFVNMAFERPEEFAGKDMELASDELTMLEICRVLSRVVGHEVVYENIPIEEMRAQSPEMADMTEWLNEFGYKADIEALRKLHPGLTAFESWLYRHGWDKISASRAA